MNAIEADADLLAACRTRARLLHEMEHADQDLVLAEFIAALARCVSDPDVSAAAERKRTLETALAAVNDAVAEAVAEHLMNPAPVTDTIAVLPRGAVR